MTRREAAAVRPVVVLCAALAGLPAHADDPDAAPVRPSAFFAAEAKAALDGCMASRRDAGERTESCAFIGARLCEAADPDGRAPAAQEACALAEYLWWTGRIEARLAELSGLIRHDGRTDPERDIAMMRSAQAAWQAHALAHCNLDTLVLYHWPSLTGCMVGEAAARAAWLFGPAGEF